MADAFIGLDLGTTSIKAVAFDTDDHELAAASLPTPTHTVETGAEYDADELWATAASVLRSVTSSLADHTPIAIATASMGESGVLIGADGRPLAPVIAWFDTRTEPQVDWWRDQVGSEPTRRVTGLMPRPVFGAMKMRWTFEHRPDDWAQSRAWLHMADWAAFCLSRAVATDFSLASRTMLLDLVEAQWSHGLLDACGLDPAKLPPLRQAGTPIGRVTAEAAAATGLPEGAVVGVGGQDHVCAALALGVTEPAMLLDSIGTAEAFFLVTDGVDTTGRLAAAMIGQGLHVEPGRTYAMTGLQQGGGRIDARRRQLGLDWGDFFETSAATQIIDEVAGDGQRRIAELLDAAEVAEVQHLVTGGGSANERLIERKREIGGRPIEVADQPQATALGAAILARRAFESS